MTHPTSLRDQLMHRVFGIPTVAQWWAKFSAWQSRKLIDTEDAIPFTPLSKPLAECTAALITTGGIHLPDQPPFDSENWDGDATYREIPGDVNTGEIVISHRYYDHSDADEDLNVIFPLDHFRDLVGMGVVGGLGPRHFGFMGHIEGDLVDLLVKKTAPEVAAKLRADGVDFAFLTPA